jgi:succinyl-diaminopimelate desuccinylase
MDVITLTQELIRIPTINPPGNESECVEHLALLLESAGFKVSRHDFADRRVSLVARLGTGHGKPICFTGHVDTVPLGFQPWSVDPFSGSIDGGQVFGRGSSDMKSGVAAFVVAAIEMAPVISKSSGVVLIITAGEETGCEGARHLASKDGALKDAGAIVVAEPTSNYPLVGHKGALWLRVRIDGVTAHGSQPEHGENAILKAAHMITRLELFDFQATRHAILGEATLNVGSIEGGMNINSVPDLTKVGIDIRTIPGLRHEQLRKRLERHMAPELASLETIVDLEGIWTEPDEEWVQQIFSIMGDILETTIEPRTVNYFTDAAVLTPAYGFPPTIILGPGEATMAHQTDEYCRVERISEAVEAYKRIIIDWCDR